jgi:hypothetical protein
MSKTFDQFVKFFDKNSSNNYAIYSDYILFDELYLDFLDFPREPYFQNFRHFYKYGIIKKKIPELLALYYFKFCHSTQVDIYKENLVHHILSPYKERSRVISYPINRSYNFFLTITFRSPFVIDEFDLYSVISFNDYLNGQVKKGFKRFRDYVRRHYYLELRKEFSNMSVEGIETFFGYVPETKELNRFLNQEASRMTRETFYYFRVYETHKSNVIHCHALIQIPDFLRQMDFRELIQLIASWFETEFNGIELDRIRNDKKGNGNSAVRGYILKYMFKQFRLDNLVCVNKSEQEKVFVLKTSAFVMNFIPRVISYSRGTQVKKFRPHSSYSSEALELPVDYVYRECSLVENAIQEVSYEELKLIVDRFNTIHQKKHQNLLRTMQSVSLLNAYLEDDVLVASQLDDIRSSLDRLRFNSDYSALFYSASLKLNRDLSDVVDF